MIKQYCSNFNNFVKLSFPDKEDENNFINDYIKDPSITGNSYDLKDHLYLFEEVFYNLTSSLDGVKDLFKKIKFDSKESSWPKSRK